MNATARSTEPLALAIRDAVTAEYLENGKPSDVARIAGRVGWSEAKVRKVIGEHHGAVSGTSAHHEARASYSKSYRGFQSGSHRVWVYYPTLEHLRELLNLKRDGAS